MMQIYLKSIRWLGKLNKIWLHWFLCIIVRNIVNFLYGPNGLFLYSFFKSGVNCENFVHTIYSIFQCLYYKPSHLMYRKTMHALRLNNISSSEYLEKLFEFLQDLKKLKQKFKITAPAFEPWTSQSPSQCEDH